MASVREYALERELFCWERDVCGWAALFPGAYLPPGGPKAKPLLRLLVLFTDRCL